MLGTGSSHVMTNPCNMALSVLVYAKTDDNDNLEGEKFVVYFYAAVISVVFIFLYPKSLLRCPTISLKVLPCTKTNLSIYKYTVK